MPNLVDERIGEYAPIYRPQGSRRSEAIVHLPGSRGSAEHHEGV